MKTRTQPVDYRRKAGASVLLVALAWTLAAPAGADPSGTAQNRRPVHSSFDAAPFTEPNPCTGQEQTVHVSIEGRLQVFETDGRYHVSGTGTLHVRTSLGFEGTAQHNFHENGAKDGDQLTYHESFAAVLSDGSGLRYRVHNLAQLTIADGEIRSLIMEGDPEFACLGNGR